MVLCRGKAAAVSAVATTFIVKLPGGGAPDICQEYATNNIWDLFPMQF